MDEIEQDVQVRVIVITGAPRPDGRPCFSAGGDLKGNHPVGIPYPYNGVRNTYNGSTTGVNTPLAEYRPIPTKVKMFTDPTVVSSNTGIECGSCHNPHDNANGAFLRDAKLTICQNCHVK